MFKLSKEILKINFLFEPNKNQLRDIERLIFEIIKRDNISLDDVINYIKANPQINKYAGRNKFFIIKDTLIKRRFPLTSKNEKIDAKNVFLNKIRPCLENPWQVKMPFKPLKIFIEKDVSNSYLAANFRKKFADVEIEEIDYYSQYLKENKFTLTQLKKPLIFITKEKWDFLKPCPCTKHHLCCGYWIFNLGFGCPFDCSYCFLQQYTNFPGIILPANLDDFFMKFDLFYKNLKKPIRIGTGEFCDSLALDDITEYSKKLIPYFKEKNLLFELKTKSANIDNVLQINASGNIVISWSLNPPTIINKEELGTPSLKERLSAAKKVQDKGYKIGFHFDPIIHFQNWLDLYKEIIVMLYSQLTPPFAWISLGTLRSNRQLKTINEARFPHSNIFYGELFLGEDKKLRYSKSLRQDIYTKMINEIKTYDSETPLYLCMENKEMWESTLGKSTILCNPLHNLLIDNE